MTDPRPRVWERFLTEQDRAHLAQRTDRRGGWGERPALVLVDLYRAVFGDRRLPLLESVRTWPSSCGEAAWDALPHIQRLLAGVRAAGLPVIHITALVEGGLCGPSRSSRAAFARRATDPSALERDRAAHEIVPEAAPLPGELVLRKSGPSAFWGTPLVGELVRQGVDTVIVVGESTSGCVRATVVDGFTHRYRMIVVEECVFDRHEAAHAIDLFDMHQKYADVLGLDEVLEHVRARAT